MKNNKFTKAISIVMSSVVAGVVMGSGTCSAAPKELDKAKKLVKGLTTSQIVKDGRKFVKDGRKFVNDVSNNISNRDVLFFTAGSSAVAAIALGVAYYGYPNGLADLAKHIVTADVGGSQKVKLLALRLKDYKFVKGTADAFLLISADYGKAATTEVLSAEKGELNVNEVYEATSENELAFKELMGRYAKGKTHGKLKVVTIDASHLFGVSRSVREDKFVQEFANELISYIEDSAKSSKSNLVANEEDVDEGSDEEEGKKIIIKAKLYAAEVIGADSKASKEVKVKSKQGEDGVTIDAKLADDVKAEIEVNGEVKVIFEVEGRYNRERREVTLTDGSVIKDAELVEAAAEN